MPYIDANKIYLMGYSAGGHLSLLYAYSSNAQISSQYSHSIAGVIAEASPFVVVDSLDYTLPDFLLNYSVIDNLVYGIDSPYDLTLANPCEAITSMQNIFSHSAKFMIAKIICKRTMELSIMIMLFIRSSRIDARRINNSPDSITD